MQKKSLFIVLCLLLLMLIFSVNSQSDIDSAAKIFNELDINMNTWSSLVLPESPELTVEADGTFENAAQLVDALDPNNEGIYSIYYDWQESKQWLERGSSINFMQKDTMGKNRDSYKAELEDLLNNSFAGAMDNAFFRFATAYIRANNPNISVEQASSILKQVLVQMEINKFFPDSVMTSYALSASNSATFNKDVDAKNPIFGARKYLITPLDNGYIISSRSTNEADTIKPLSENENQTSVLVNAKYGWDQLSGELASLLGESYSFGANPEELLIPVESLNSNQAQLSMTGSGMLLALGDKSLCFKMESSDPKTMANALKTICENYLTLNSYAQIGGALGLNLKVYFDTGEKTYNIDSITSLSDLLTGVFGEAILLKEDTAIQAKAGDPIDDPKASTNPDSSEGPKLMGEEEPITTASFTTLEPTDTPAPTEYIETTASPVPTKEPATQVEVLKLLVNFRKAPGKGILFKVKKGTIGEIVGETIKFNGWRWYNVKIDDAVGYLRHDCLKELDIPVTITPKPGDIENTEVPTADTQTGDTQTGDVQTGDVQTGDTQTGDVQTGDVQTGDTQTGDVQTTDIVSAILKRGSKGDDVKALQERLIELGYLSAVADGKFGRKTEAAIKEAQGYWGLKADGLAGEDFISKLYSQEATSLSEVKLQGLKPDTMRVPTKPIITGAAYMKKTYEKTEGGYTTGINFENKGAAYSLTASCLDNYSTTFELKMAFNDLQGAKAISPSLKLNIINLYVQDVNKIELIKKGLPQELPSHSWSVDTGLISIDLSNNSELIAELTDSKNIDSIRLYGNETSYSIDFNKTSPPFLVTKYMAGIWKDINGAEIALAARQ